MFLTRQDLAGCHVGLAVDRELTVTCFRVKPEVFGRRTFQYDEEMVMEEKKSDSHIFPSVRSFRVPKKRVKEVVHSLTTDVRFALQDALSEHLRRECGTSRCAEFIAFLDERDSHKSLPFSYYQIGIRLTESQITALRFWAKN